MLRVLPSECAYTITLLGRHLRSRVLHPFLLTFRAMLAWNSCVYKRAVCRRHTVQVCEGLRVVNKGKSEAQVSRSARNTRQA